VHSFELTVATPCHPTLRQNGKLIDGHMGYLPFGGGATYCPGRRFARNEVTFPLPSGVVPWMHACGCVPHSRLIFRHYSTSQIKTALAVLLTEFDIAIVDPPGAASSAASSGSVYDSRDPRDPGRDHSRAGLIIFPPAKQVKVSVTRRR